MAVSTAANKLKLVTWNGWDHVFHMDIFLLGWWWPYVPVGFIIRRVGDDDPCLTDRFVHDPDQTWMSNEWIYKFSCLYANKLV
jgi:hypothetical protein